MATLPIAGAQSATESIQANGLNANGTFQLTGTPVALQFHANETTTTALTGYAEEIQWIADWSERVDTTGPISYETGDGKDSTTWPASNVEIRADGPTPSLLLSLQQPDPLRFDVNDLALNVDTAPLTFPNWVGDSQQPFQTGNGALLAIRVGHPLNLDYQGDIKANFWDTTATSTTGEQWSGQQRTPIAGPATPVDGAAWQTRDQILHASIQDFAGDLHVDDATVYFADVRITGTGSLSLLGPGIGELVGDELQIEGNLDLSLNSITGGKLNALVHGAESAKLDGQEITLATTARGTAAQTPWWIPVAMIAALAGAFLLVNKTPKVSLRRMERRLERHDYAAVVRVAGPALRSKTTAPRASVYKATSLLALGHFKEARLFLAGRSEEKRPDPATFHFLNAQAAGGLNQHQESAEHLRQCLALEPAYIQEARQLPQMKKALALIEKTAPLGRDAYA